MKTNELLEVGWQKKFGASGLPAHMVWGVVRWICYGIEPGSFLKAVIDNDLRKAVVQADDTNINFLKEWAQFFHNTAPHGCSGDRTIARIWQERGGMQGILSESEEPRYHTTHMPGSTHRRVT